MTPPAINPKPKVIFWYRLYATGMFGLYFIILVAMILLAILVPFEELKHTEPDLPPIFFMIYFVAISSLSLVMAAVFALSFFLKNRPWTWVYHLVLICLGFGSPCCLPASIPLLIFWIKDDTRHYFGRR